MKRARPAARPWIRNSPDSATFWVVVLGLLGTLPLVLLTPPLQVPDEPQHFERAYQISRLDLMAHANGRAGGAILPASISGMVRDQLGTTALDAARPVTARPLAMSLRGLSRPLDPKREVFTDFTGAAPYSPLPYMPQAIAISLGRLLGAGPLALLYAARLANALASVLLLTLAVRAMPIAREALAIAGLMPMALYQYASASPDAMTISTALLFTAIATRALVRGWTGRDAVGAALLGAVFCSHKLVYAPLLLVALPAVLVSGNRLHRILTNGLIALFAIGVAAMWLAANGHLMLTRAPGTDVHAQAAFIVAEPLAFTSILSANLFGRALYYCIGLVGLVGWSTVPLPAVSYVLALVAVILAVLIRGQDEPTIPRVAGLWLLLLVAGGAILIEVALYLTWNAVGSRLIEGVQGRYFLPLLGLFLVALHTLLRLPEDEARSRLIRIVVLALASVQILALDATIISAFAVF